MRRNSLTGFAKTLVNMAVSEGSEALCLAVADLPDGVLHVDLLTRTASLDGTHLSSNAAIERLSEWLHTQASRSRATTPSSMVEARLELTLDSTSIPTARQSLLHYFVAPRSVLRTPTQFAEASLPPQHLWIRRNTGV